MVNSESAASKYLHEVKRGLICPHDSKVLLQQRLEKSIFAFLDDHPEADGEALYLEFGTPEKAAAQLLEDCPEDKLRSEQKKRSQSRFFILGVAVLVVTLSIALSVFWCVKGRYAEVTTTIFITQSKQPDDQSGIGEFTVTHDRKD